MCNFSWGKISKNYGITAMNCNSNFLDNYRGDRGNKQKNAYWRDRFTRWEKLQASSPWLEPVTPDIKKR